MVATVRLLFPMFVIKCTNIELDLNILWLIVYALFVDSGAIDMKTRQVSSAPLAGSPLSSRSTSSSSGLSFEGIPDEVTRLSEEKSKNLKGTSNCSIMAEFLHQFQWYMYTSTPSPDPSWYRYSRFFWVHLN